MNLASKGRVALGKAYEVVGTTFDWSAFKAWLRGLHPLSPLACEVTAAINLVELCS